ncbi:MAG TPA: efflux RND transporter periplasmic adaptor subunit, partial [Cellvibrionaceae bacterium]|nr:efflux RND transporter periplasmic adaptor subunit [Cellvibrionaceae bacterium]
MSSLFNFINSLKSKKRWLTVGLISLFFTAFTFSVQAKDEHGHDHGNEKAESAAHGETEHDEHEEHEEKAAELTDAQLTTAAIETAQAGPADIQETIPLYGTIEANGERIQHINARFPGIIKSVNKKLGDSVKQDEVLASIEGNESLRTYSVAAAFSGVVVERNANPGEHTDDKSLFVIADLSTVWVEVAVFPRDLAKVKAGQRVRITQPSSNFHADGNIIAIGSLGSANQSLNARVLLENNERHWIPGMFVNAAVSLATTSVKLAIHNEALQEHEGKQVVFVKTEKGFEPRPVKLGRTDGDLSEVLGGLSAGE